jgi:hypothetical protein
MPQQKQRRTLTYRPNKKIPHVPVGERKIKKIEQLPPHLQRVLDRYPSYVGTETAEEIRGLSRTSLYTAAAEGRVIAVKDGASLKWDVASLLIDLANLPIASLSSGASRHPATATAEA